MKKTIIIVLVLMACFGTAHAQSSKKKEKESRPTAKNASGDFGKLFADVILAKRRDKTTSLACDGKLANYLKNADAGQVIGAFWTLKIYASAQRANKSAPAVRMVKKLLYLRKNYLGMDDSLIDTAFDDDEIDIAFNKFTEQE